MRFYAVPPDRVIFTAKTSFDIFSLSREQVWTFSVFGDRIYEISSREGSREGLTFYS